jgi:NAD(P)-dependent dehydrogenase (short-subunit alcohol dehydrogenase family)
VSGSGIGRACALRLGVPCCLILVLDRDGEAAAQTARAVGARGGHGAAVGCDVTDQADIQAAVATVGVLINSAGPPCQAQLVSGGGRPSWLRMTPAASSTGVRTDARLR